MSVFDEILCKINEISIGYARSLNDDIKVAFECLDKFAEEYQNGGGKRDQNQKKALVNTLMSINEDADENSPKEDRKSKDGQEKRLSNKRSKELVDGMSSPEQDKRQKRNASVKAQNKITKQSACPLQALNQNVLLVSDEEGDTVNVNLTQKMRREDATEKSSRRRKDDDKENALPLVQVKQEKISLSPEPMETDATLNIPIKQEPNKDEVAMPPPPAPVPKRGRPAKEKSTDSEDEQGSGRRTRTRNNAETMLPPAAPAPMDRPARASRRNTKQSEVVEPPPEPRPKRTRAKKLVSESSTESESTQQASESCVASPADKPRPKRTRRGKKAAEEQEAPQPKEKEPSPEPQIIIPKKERISVPDPQSPAIPQKTVKKTKNDTTVSVADVSIPKKKGKGKVQEVSVDNTVGQMDATVTISMDKTVVLPNGVYDHTDGKNAAAMNETVVLDKLNRDTMVLDKPQAKIMDSTVVLEKDAAKEGTPNITDDLSLLTDDNSSQELTTPPKEGNKQTEPTSAVKAKVQQFEEMAARTTRTKTRAMAKKDAAEPENCTPPDKILPKHVLSADTLSKMNSMIFNGKTAQTSISATKPTAKLPPMKTMPASASKVTAINKAREEQLSKDDARRKKEAMLEAKKEQQRRKREDKMAAAAAAREAAERERRAAMQAAARDRMEKQAHADQGKLERLKEAERKKQELARKVAETEERRRVEEAARMARLADEQRKADAYRKRQLEESEAMKKEAAMMAKEIEKRQKEYLEKQKMKQKMEADKMHTPLKNGTPCGKTPMEPVYMADGFQYLNSDDDDDAPPKFPTPAWCKTRHRQLALQQLLPQACVDRLFTVREHTVDLRAIFPALERHALKRTSSAVWRTPPPLHMSVVHESPV